ncbi:MAG: diacylglycerol/lipid kinase family protein, partial [Deinococcus sp.]
VLGSLRQPRSAELEVWADGQPFYRGPGCLAAVMNGRRYGGGFRIAPDADPADGRLELVLGGQLGRAELLGLMGRLRLGRHLGHPQVRHVRARQVGLRWSEPMFLHLDGEVGGELAGEVLELEAGVRPGALRFLSGRLPG